MSKTIGNKGLLDKSRFEDQDRQKERWLGRLSLKDAMHLEEKMLSSRLIWEWRNNFGKDSPVCLKIFLKEKRAHG
ncbi:MAG: hypothetical protein JW787_13900 [Sedimentisphaerales bacterium]|nr:hypothetical protein [Sedimentisphaerales bacterium]